jgi:hypothetical protein
LDSPAEGCARIGRHDVSPDQRDASSDRQVDEEDRAPVGNLGEDARSVPRKLVVMIESDAGDSIAAPSPGVCGPQTARSS